MKIKSIILFLSFFFLGNTLIAQNLTGIKILINPGHGGWDSDDRGIKTPLIPDIGPEKGFWESQSNLDKGLQLRDMLEEKGATVIMSRLLNRTEDDLALSAIVQMANEANVDYMLSIHSNAGAGTANSVLMLYAGISPGDSHTYPTPTPYSDESRAVSTIIAQNLYKNQLTHWTSNYSVQGDKTFGRTAMGWSDGYGVLRGLRVPGVISEGSMHDYIPETYRLMNMEYKWLEAWNFMKTFCTYYERGDIPTGNISGWVKDSRNLLLDGDYTKYGKDKLLPLNGAKITILETGDVYTVDNMNNGVYVFKNLTPNTYTVKAEAEGYYPQEEILTVEKNEITYFNFELNKIRNTAPQVKMYSPNVVPPETVTCAVDILLEFNWDMDIESTTEAFSITPHIDGKISFEDSQYRMRFVPNLPYEKSTLYTVKLDKSAKHPDNLTLEEDFIFQFMTDDRNRLVMLEGFPNNEYETVHLPVKFWYVFDKKLDAANLRESINVYDDENNIIAKATRSVKNNNVPAPYGAFYFELAENLQQDKNYKLVIDGNVKDQDNIKVVEKIEINFKTADIKVTDKDILETFESTELFTYQTSDSENVKSASAARNTSNKLFDNSSYNFKVEFTEKTGFVNYKCSENYTISDKNMIVGLHVNGDLTGNEIQLEILTDNGIEHLKICDLNFLGWQFVQAKINLLSDSQSYKIIGFRIVRKDAVLSTSTNIYIDNMLMFEDDGSMIPNINIKDISVFPNPVSDIVFVKSETHHPLVLQLYTLNGQFVKESFGTEMSVHDINNGTYMLKVKCEQGDYNQVLIVSKK